MRSVWSSVPTQASHWIAPTTLSLNLFGTRFTLDSPGAPSPVVISHDLLGTPSLSVSLRKSTTFDRMQNAMKTFAVDETSVSRVACTPIVSLFCIYSLCIYLCF